MGTFTGDRSHGRAWRSDAVRPTCRNGRHGQTRNHVAPACRARVIAWRRERARDWTRRSCALRALQRERRMPCTKDRRRVDERFTHAEQRSEMIPRMVEQHYLTGIFHELDCEWFARQAANQENYRGIEGTPDWGRHCMMCDGASDRAAHELPLPGLKAGRGIGVAKGLAIAGAGVAVTAAVAAWAERTKVRRSRRARSEAVSAAADAAHDGVPPVLDPVDPAMSVPTAPPGVASRHVVRASPPVRLDRPCADQRSSARSVARNGGHRRPRFERQPVTEGRSARALPSQALASRNRRPRGLR